MAVLSLAKRRRRGGSVAPPVPVLGNYVGSNWWRRNRARLISLFVTACLLYGALYGLFPRAMLMPLLVPIAVLAGLIIWLLPEVDSPPTQLLSELLFAFLVALLCWPDYMALTLPGLPWITAIRIVGIPLALILLICLSVSARFRRELSETLSAAPLVSKLLGVFAGIALLSIAFSTEKNDSLSKFIVAQLYWTSIYFCAVHVFRKPGRALQLAYLLWVIILYVGLIAMWEWRLKHLPWLGHIPSFLAVEDPAVQNILTAKARAANGIYRVQSKFTTPLGLAEFLALATPFVIHLIITHRALAVRVAAFLTLPFVFYIVILTDSRLGVVGFFMALLIYTLYWSMLRWRWSRNSIVGPAAILAYPILFAAFIGATFTVPRLHNMVWGGGAQQFSTESRKEQIEKGIPLVLSHPWGYGIGRGGPTLHFANRAGQTSIDTYFLSVALEYGIIGFFVYYGMILSSIYYGTMELVKRGARAYGMLIPLCIAMTNFFIIKSIFSQQENHPLVFAIMGCLTAMVWQSRTDVASGRPTDAVG